MPGCSVGTRAGSLERAQVDSDSPVRVFLVLENRLLREAMDRIFRKRNDFLVVGSDRKEACAPQKILESQSNVVVLDFVDLDWVKLTRGTKSAGRAQPRLLLVGMDSDFEQFLAAVRAGVTSYLLKDASTEEVLSAVRSTSAGLAICPPALCATLLQYVFSTTNCRPAVGVRPLLTPRQRRLRLSVYGRVPLMIRKSGFSAMLRFGVFEVDLRSGELRKQGKRVRLQEQPFQVLTVLLQRPNAVVTREKLRSQIWPQDTFVDFDNSLNTAISKLREALGDSADNPRFIETLPRRGYRFLAFVNDSPLVGSGN